MEHTAPRCGTEFSHGGGMEGWMTMEIFQCPCDPSLAGLSTNLEILSTRLIPVLLVRVLFQCHPYVVY